MILARELSRTVAECKATVSSTEFSAWLALFAMEGGAIHHRLEVQLAAICTINTNAAGGKAEIDDFLMAEKAPPKPMTDMEIWESIKMQFPKIVKKEG